MFLSLIAKFEIQFDNLKAEMRKGYKIAINFLFPPDDKKGEFWKVVNFWPFFLRLPEQQNTKEIQVEISRFVTLGSFNIKLLFYIFEGFYPYAS